MEYFFLQLHYHYSYTIFSQQADNDTPFLVINIIMIISTLTAMTVLTMLYQGSREVLKGYNIGAKFWLVKIGLMIDNLQSALLNVFASFMLLGCKIPFPLPVRANREYKPFAHITTKIWLSFGTVGLF